MSLSLEVFNLFKQYEGKNILMNCSYSFDEVGIYGLIGPNGRLTAHSKGIGCEVSPRETRNPLSD